jgi:uncharacterized membrane protein
MKWIYLIVSFFVKRLGGIDAETRHPMDDVKEYIKENALKMFVGMVSIVMLGTLFTAGITLTAFTLASRYDQGLAPQLTAVAASGIVMIVFSLAVLLVALYISSPHEKSSRRRKAKHAKELQAGSIQEAVVMLLNDHLKEREAKREAIYHDRELARRAYEMNVSAPRSEEFPRH